MVARGFLVIDCLRQVASGALALVVSAAEAAQLDGVFFLQRYYNYTLYSNYNLLYTIESLCCPVCTGICSIFVW